MQQEITVIEVTKGADGVFDLSPYTDDGMSFNVHLTGRLLCRFSFIFVFIFKWLKIHMFLCIDNCRIL